MILRQVRAVVGRHSIVAEDCYVPAISLAPQHLGRGIAGRATPIITICPDVLALGYGFAGIDRPASDILSWTKRRTARRSTLQQEVAFSADAASASPVRKLKQA